MKQLILVSVCLLVLSSCGTVTGTGDAGDGDELDGRTFLSTAVTQDGSPRPLVEGSRIQLSLEDGRLTARAGCNTLLAGAQVEDGLLLVDEIGMTEMGCPDDLMAQDAWLAELLGSRPVVALEGEELTLTSGPTVVTLMDRAVADPDRPLVGTVWRVVSIISGEAVSSTPGRAEATLTFGEDGTLHVRGACNQGSGAWTRDDGDGGGDVDGDGTVTVDEVLMTAVGCDDARGELDAAVTRVLGQGELSVDISADRLTLRAGDEGLVLRADAP